MRQIGERLSSRLAWALAATLVSVVLVLAHGAVSPVLADPCNGPVGPGGICLGTDLPGSPPTTGPGTPPSTGDVGCSDRAGRAVPCVNGFGFVWVGAPHWCYGFQLDPQPPVGNPIWNGHDPADGSVWSCDPTVAVTGNTWFVPSGHAVVDAAQVARDLVKRAPFEFADAHAAPGPDYHTYVNYKNWLWIPPEQWHDVGVSLTVAGATISLQAAPTRVDWDMGDGQGVACAGPGRVWNDGMPEDAPTGCSFTYAALRNSNGDSWLVSARISYAVSWSCTGNCSSGNGDLGEVSARPGKSTAMTVLQRQTVVTR